VKTAVLVASIALIAFVPAGLQVIVSQASEALTDRAASTPLLVGAKGSALDVTLSAIYFARPSVDPLPYRELGRINESGLAKGIPLHLRYTAGGYPVVGTTTDYFDFRSVRCTEGRPMALLGECVLGATVARRLGLAPDSSLMSAPATAFDVVGTTPLKMRVVGVLEPAGSVDDEAVFVDVKTAWVIAGIAHGHMDMTTPEAEGGVLSRTEGNVVANASVLPYNEITAENIDSFHFHGDPSDFPLDAILVLPNNLRSGILLRGRYQERSESIQMLVPKDVIRDLMSTVFSVRDFVVMGSLAIGLATLATSVLVFVLSIRLRRREIETIRKIGGAEGRIRGILAMEILLVIGLSSGLTGVLVFVLARVGLALVLTMLG
jgi:putative ABC transport system permease protein